MRMRHGLLGQLRTLQLTRLEAGAGPRSRARGFLRHGSTTVPRIALVVQPVAIDQMPANAQEPSNRVSGRLALDPVWSPLVCLPCTSSSSGRC